jgi:mono/diheme cytochrome c family protein
MSTRWLGREDAVKVWCAYTHVPAFAAVILPRWHGARGCNQEISVRTKPIALGLAVLMLAGLTADCASKENAFEAARRNERDGTAAASSPQPAATPASVPSDSQAGTPAGSPAKGQALFTAQGCAACHSTGSNTVVGPGLEGVGTRAGTRVEGLGADAYIKQSIRDPGAFLVPGFNNLMPTIYSSLPDSDLNDLAAYLLSLK